MASSDDRKEWPDTIEDTERNAILVNLKVILSREEFNNGVGKLALALMHKGTAPLRSTEEVRKYILEFEILD